MTQVLFQPQRTNEGSLVSDVKHDDEPSPSDHACVRVWVPEEACGPI